MSSSNYASLSDIIFSQVEPDERCDAENIADALLRESSYEQALSSYLLLDPTVPRLTVKIAYCEWRLDKFDDAFHRLRASIAMLDGDGIGLLSSLISNDPDSWQREDDYEAQIWPWLNAVTSANTVPLIAVFARFQGEWTEDIDNPAQKLRDLSHLLFLYPDCQPLRLAVAESMQQSGNAAEDQYAVLAAIPSSVLMPRYLWALARASAEVGKYACSLNYLSQLEEIETRNDPPSASVLWHIERARCAIQAETNPPDAASGFILLGQGTSSSSESQITAFRFALAAACKSADHLIPELAECYLKELESLTSNKLISSTALFNESIPFKGSNWDACAQPWPCCDLTPYKHILISSLQGRTQQFFRALFANYRIETDYLHTDEPVLGTALWDNLAEELGDVTQHPERFNGELLSLYTIIHAHRARPNWAKLGGYWIMSVWKAFPFESTLHHRLLIAETINKQTDFLRKFASGVIKYLRSQVIPSPMAYDLVKDLVASLHEHRLYKELNQLISMVGVGDKRQEIQFYLALSLQNINKKVSAISTYWKILHDDPTHYPTLINMLSLCTKQADTPLLQALELYIFTFNGDTQKEKGLRDALESAQSRCKDKIAAEALIIANYLSRFPAPLEGNIALDDISLLTAVALLALYRCADAEPDDSFLISVDESRLHFSPVLSDRNILFNLLSSGLASVHPTTPPNAFVIVEGEVSDICISQIRWRMSDASRALVKQLRDINGDIPDHWYKDLIPFAQEIAQGEIVEYLGFLAEERKWPRPRNTDALSDLTRELVDELSVAQAFNLAYLGAMSASDYRQKYSVSAQQATDMLIRRTGDRLEAVRNGKYLPNSYNRPWKLPRSVLSIVLWKTLLNRGDEGFTQKFSDMKIEREQPDRADNV
ncbi:hypothetical protein [Candidatus Pantoea multigeneris]|uniref:Tetratricopeptide repeat protein n=1 Tax=Candidatus Pantoea multigeneris TaxID=2608357 RepID=A0ABX0RJK9_9GAMM|nr:hypothetical protein [Pantoea multigeneris]NIF23814.1 hypothetical protein [Pantoea multigeneris]